MTTRDPAVISAALVRDWVQHALAGLGEARAHIDALNVYPVPDGDTGTNLYLTVASAATSVSECCEEGESADGPGSVSGAAAASAMATGALMGARGNSGVIMSQILRGAGDVLGQTGDVLLDGGAVHRMLRRASDLAYEAVAHPVEGTILTVIRGAADGAAAALGGGDVPGAAGGGDARRVLSAALEAAQDALDRTPTMLESLRLAGVVDAGGQGLIVVLTALHAALDGAPVPDTVTDTAVDDTVQPHVVPPDYEGPAYEVMYLLDADPDDIPDLKATLDALGDSLVLVGADRLWNIHVHVDDAGAAVEAGLAVGRPSRIRITHLLADHTTLPSRSAAPAARRLVAVSHAPGVAQLLERAGVITVAAQPQVRPSTAELLAGIEEASAAEVVVLPSDKDTTGVAEIAAQEARAAGVRVSVIPTRSIVQSLAAVAVHDPDARFDEDVVAMTRAVGATRYGAVTIASRDALTTVGPCRVGDVLGLVDGDIVLVGSDVTSVVRDMLTGMLAVGGELVTLLYGCDASADLRSELESWLDEAFPLAEVVAYDAGQPLWPLILGVE